MDLNAGETPGESVLNVDELSGHWLTGELQLRRRVRARHTITGGALVMAHLDRTPVSRDIEPAFEYLNERHRGAQYGAYLQDEYQPFRSLIVNAGARYDWFSTFGSALNPRVAVIYNPVAPTALKVPFGRAFRAPSPEELYHQDSGISPVASPELDPETITTYDLVVEQRVGSAMRATASAYRYHVDEEIREQTQPDTGLIKLVNLGMARAQGVELGLEANWPDASKGARATLAARRGCGHRKPARQLTWPPPQTEYPNASRPMGHRGGTRRPAHAHARPSRAPRLIRTPRRT